MMIQSPEELPRLCHSLLWPLNLFYSRFDRQMPQITPLFEQHMPEPYKRLLVHKKNMTPTLEAYHSDTIHIERVNMLPGNEQTTREVILRLDRNNKPVEYGASRIFLRKLPPKALPLVAEGKVPLGTILRICECTHTVEVAGFFKVKPTSFFEEIFESSETSPLFGRRNTLTAPDGTAIAEVCEILPSDNDEAND
jgi:chorismate-pyruvate lyase